MTATNINIEEFIRILTDINRTGVNFMDLDMIPDVDYPEMNKLVIHPVKKDTKTSTQENRISIRNPDISSDGDDIFDLMYR